jgi:hypothetical protein
LRVEPLEQRNLLSGLKLVPSPIVAGSQLIGTAAIAANDVWAVGDINSGAGFTTLAEHFDGTSWSVVPTASLKKGGFFEGVAKVASNDVWAVGGEGSLPPFQPLIEHWNGTSWSTVSTPPLSNGGFLNGVTAVSSTDVWAVGVINNSSDSLVEHWDGTSWSVISSPAFTGAGGLNGVSADGRNDVWAVGATVLHWNGQAWSQVAAPPAVGLGGVTALSPTNAWAVGSQRLTSKLVRAQIEHWDGTSWGIFPNPDPGTSFSALNGIAAVSASDIWAVGQVFGQTLTEHWDGASWKIINSPNPGAGGNRLFGVTALSTGTVVAVGDSVDSSGVSNGLILSNAPSGGGPKTAMIGAWRMPAAAPATPSPTAAQTTTPALPLDAALLDQFFAVPGNTDQLLPLAGHNLSNEIAMLAAAASQSVVTLSANVTIVPGQGLPAFTVRVGAHASGPANGLTGRGFDTPFQGNPTGTPGYCRFDVLTGSLVGDLLTLTGTVAFSSDPSLVGIRASITANSSTGAITFNFGGIILTGTGSVVVAHR